MKKSYQEYMMYRIYWILIMLGLPIWITAQTCEMATVLNDVTNYCSANGEFSNEISGQKWFRFTATQEAVSIKVLGNGFGGTLEQPLIQVLIAECGTTEIFDPSLPTTVDTAAVLIGALEIGRSYVFVVSGNNNEVGTFQLCVNNFIPISNDECDGATEILIPDAEKTCTTYSNEGATGATRLTTCMSNEGQDVWFKFTAINKGVRILATAIGNRGTIDQPELMLFSTDQCDNLSFIDCTPGSFSQNARIEYSDLEIGNTYLLRVQGKNGSIGTFDLCIENYELPTNDFCQDALSIVINDENKQCASYSNEGTTETLITSCFSKGNDVWFKFTPLNAGVRINVNGNGKGGTIERPELALYVGSCDAGIELDCQQGNFSQVASIDYGGLSLSETYFIRVQGQNESIGSFELCIENYETPVNDLCQNAIPLTDVTDFCEVYSNIDASATSDMAGTSCFLEEGSDVWFIFRATQPALELNVLGRVGGGTMTSPEVQLFNTGTCGNLSNQIIDCAVGNNSETANITTGGLIPGNNYLIRVQGKKGEEGTFELCIKNFPSPPNDFCYDPIVISDVVNYCSADGEFNNLLASPDPDMPTICGSNKEDVWFSFTAIATDLVINIIGAVNSEFPGGTLERPEVAILEIVECPTEFIEFGALSNCGADIENENLVNFSFQGLRIGVEYFIRVQGANTGTFKLCVNNFSPNFPPAADCVDARLLCDKSAIYVEPIEGGGNDPDEARGTCLDGGGGNSEINSVWYKWIAGNNEDLVFTLSPDSESDDIDFVLYELPGGIDDCDNKIAIRCNAAGANGIFDANGVFIKDPVSEWSRCVGEGGLAFGDDDILAPPGCPSSDDDNFLAPLQLEEGKAYALLVNFFDFSNTSGFFIEFDGPGEFQGLNPIPEIVSDDPNICVGDEITYTGQSSFFIFGDEAISEYEWFFGAGAEPSTATGIGPHDVLYTTPGEKNISLTLLSSRFSCKATDEIFSIVDIQSCCEINGVVATSESEDEVCDESNGSIDLTIESKYAYSIDWNIGSRDENLSNLEDGLYAATVTNSAECSDTIVVPISDILPNLITPILEKPTCDGGVDGSIDLNIGTDNMVTWANPDSLRTILENVSEGDYAVTVVDVNGCTQDLVVELRALELTVDPILDGFQDPSCFGLEDGSISFEPTNGIAPFTYNWEGAIANTDENSVENLAAGDYKVTINDSNNCLGELEVNLTNPDPILLDVITSDVSCAGQGDGSILASIDGGVGPYNRVWTPNFTNEMRVDTGTYQLIVTDANGCENDTTVRIIEPNQIFLDLDTVENVVCAGFETGVIRVTGSGGNPAYEYSVNGTDFQNSNIIEELPAGIYTVTIRDELGCSTILTDVEIEEPEALGVAIYADDITVDLGKSTTLEADVISGSEDVSYEWSPPVFVECVDCPETEVSPVLPTDFVVTITDAIGCTAVDSVFLIVDPQRELYIPTAFSPGFDGINDRFTLYGGTSTEEIRLLRIFDRWGNLLFEESGFSLGDPSTGWDGMANGELMPAGVYAFYAVVAYIDGEEIAFEGDVTIVR